MERTTIHRSVELEVEPAEAWELVGEREGLEQWLADEVAVDVAPGAEGTVTDDGTVRKVRIERVEPGRELVFRWWPDGDEDQGSSVVISVSPGDGSGSAVRVIEVPHASTGPLAACSTSLRWEVRALVLWTCSAGALVR